MNCNEIGSMLDRVDERVPSPARRRAIDGHLATCRACREAWAAYDELAAAPVPPMPRDLSVRLAGVLGRKELEGVRQARKRRPVLAAGLFVVGSAVAGAIAWRSDAPAPAARVEQGIRPAPAAPTTPGPVAEDSARTGIAGDGEVPQPRAAPEGPAVLDPNSIVVLPQPGADPDPRFAALLREFHEEFLAQLGAVESLTVVSRTRVAPFIGSLLPEEEIARQLGAGTIMGLRLHPEEELFFSVVILDGATGASRGTSGGVLREPVTRAEVRKHVQHVVAFLEEMRTGRKTDRATRIAEARATVLNTALSDAERVHALRMLPLHSPGAFDDAIVAAALEIATTSGFANRRAYVWEVLRGVGHPYLVEPLLQSLAYDTSDYVRRMAALTLGDFRDEPRVLAALKRAQDRDVSDAVREAAKLTLLSDEERNELAVQTLLDEALPPLERLEALSIFDGRSIRTAPLTADAAQAVFDIATSSTDIATRTIAWGTLARDGIRNPTFTGALLDDVAHHPSESVRSAAARALEPYRDEPEVRAALEQAKRDGAAGVRRAARMALGETAY